MFFDKKKSESAPYPEVLLVHEWLERDGGAEKVLDSLVEIFLNPRILTLWNDDKNRYKDCNVNETFLRLFPRKIRKIISIPLMPFVWRLQKTSKYRTVVISSHLFAHHIRAINAKKFVYVHSPARYIWEPTIDTRGNNLISKFFAFFLKKIDYVRAQEAHSLAANSKYVALRILNNWGREARVIYPPVNAHRISKIKDWNIKLSQNDKTIFENLPNRFIVGASRLVSYKKIREVLRVAELTGIPAVIVGTGPEYSNLKSLAKQMKVQTFFLGRVSDEMLYAIFQKALFLVFPAVEDFGIIPVEAMAAGCPVLGNITGGVSESVIDGKTGYLTDFRNDKEIQELALKIQDIDSSECIRRAEYFDSRRFKTEIVHWLQNEF